MRMRTYLLVIVQAAALFFAAGAVAWAQNDAGSRADADYGAPESPTRASVNKVTGDAPASMALRRPSDSTPRADTRVAVPPRGMSMRRVSSLYGTPLQRHAAIGQPPITRWDYSTYRLYFEYDHVLHAVVPANPAPVAHIGQLESFN